jgi:hypothetical protein
MNKNVMLVLVVILTPIVIMGTLAVSGAERFADQKENAEHEEENITEVAEIMVPLQMVKMVSTQIDLMVSPACVSKLG